MRTARLGVVWWDVLRQVSFLRLVSFLGLVAFLGEVLEGDLANDD